MNLLLLSNKPPLEAGTDGVIRVRGSRVTLDTVVFAFAEGATAEEIAQQYPSLGLADVYAVLDYYLQRKTEVDEYLREQPEKAGHIRLQNESRFNPQGLRERLMARRAKITTVFMLRLAIDENFNNDIRPRFVSSPARS